MELTKKRITRIKKTTRIEQVFDIKCRKNHNFFIGESEILTHNCDYMTANGQAALRQIIEAFSRTARFILTCNYIERIIDPIQSRCVHFNIYPPSKKEVAIKCVEILKSEKVEYDVSTITQIVLDTYPDIRRTINALQRNSIDGKLELDEDSKMAANYMDKVLEVLKNPSSPKQCFIDIRQIIANSRVRSFDDLYRYLFDNLDVYTKDGQKAMCILHIADSQYKSSLVIDKEIEVMAMFVNLIKDLQ